MFLKTFADIAYCRYCDIAILRIADIAYFNVLEKKINIIYTFRHCKSRCFDTKFS